MEKYNYREAVLADVLQAVSDNYDLTEYEDADEAYESIYDSLFVDDSVTGNASGSYFCNAWKAEECLNHNWDEIAETAEEFGCEPIISDGWEHGAEWWDVSIRCRYLSECLTEVLEQFF